VNVVVVGNTMIAIFLLYQLENIQIKNCFELIKYLELINFIFSCSSKLKNGNFVEK
jgi:hypothetical protein